MKAVGIYMIRNNINGKAYIGQSINIMRRFEDHKRKALKGDTDNQLYIDMRTLGHNNFTFRVLEICPPHLLNKREKHYVKEYNSYTNGYNQTPGGDYKYRKGRWG